MAARKKSVDPEPLTEPPLKSRGYYSTPHGRFKSVTTIIENGWPKPALLYWASRVAAEAAVDNIPWLSALRGETQRAEAVKWLKDEHKRIKTESGDHGSAVHRYLEARLLGAPTEEPTTDHLAAAYAAVEHFLDTMTPELEAAELVVAHPAQAYAGTLDGILGFPRHRVQIPDLTVLDAKSGKSTWGEVGMQLGAYRRCPVGWTRSGVEVPVPVADRAHVLHIRPPGIDGPDHPGAGPDGWALIPVDTSDAIHDVFLHVKAVADNYSRIDKRVLGDALDTTPDSELDPALAADDDTPVAV